MTCFLVTTCTVMSVARPQCMEIFVILNIRSIFAGYSLDILVVSPDRSHIRRSVVQILIKEDGKVLWRSKNWRWINIWSLWLIWDTQYKRIAPESLQISDYLRSKCTLLQLCFDIGSNSVFLTWSFWKFTKFAFIESYTFETHCS